MNCNGYVCNVMTSIKCFHIVLFVKYTNIKLLSIQKYPHNVHIFMYHINAHTHTITCNTQLTGQEVFSQIGLQSHSVVHPTRYVTEHGSSHNNNPNSAPAGNNNSNYSYNNNILGAHSQVPGPGQRTVYHQGLMNTHKDMQWKYQKNGATIGTLTERVLPVRFISHFIIFIAQLGLINFNHCFCPGQYCITVLYFLQYCMH